MTPYEEEYKRWKKTKARKSHKCIICCKEITKGNMYFSQRVFDVGVSGHVHYLPNNRAHKKCVKNYVKNKISKEVS